MGKTITGETKPHDDVFHKEIIDTFFGKTKVTEDRTKTHTPPAKAQKLAVPKKRRFPLYLYLTPFAILILAVFYFILSTHFRSNEGEYNVKTTPSQPPIVHMPQPEYVRLVDNGIFNIRIVKELVFEGDAKTKSLVLRNSIKLAHNGKLGWARATFILKRPSNLLERNLSILAKSTRVPATLIFVLTDIHGKTYKKSITISPRWEQKDITFEKKGAFSQNKVKSISVEYGVISAGNSGDAEIYIKEMGLKNLREV